MSKKALLLFFTLSLILLLPHIVLAGSADTWIVCSEANRCLCPTVGTKYYCIYDGNWKWSTSNLLVKCNYGGQTYFADKCSASCTATTDGVIDRGDNICRSSAFATGCTAIAECNGLATGSNINYCNKGGQTYFADKCSSTCGGEDRDNICRSSGSLQTGDGCTADSACNGITAGTGDCTSTCSYSPPGTPTTTPTTTTTIPTTTTTTTMPPSTTTVTLFPSYVTAGQEVYLTVEFNYADYKQGEDAKVDLIIIKPDNSEVVWSGTDCAIGGKKWKTELSWDGSSSWQTADGKIKITSQSGYAKIEAKCNIPSGFISGTYRVRATPTIYSLPITLRAAEASFIVLSDFELAFQKLFNSVLAVFQKILSG